MDAAKNKKLIAKLLFGLIFMVSPIVAVVAIWVMPQHADIDHFIWTQKSKHDDWKVSHPIEQGFIAEKLLDMHLFIERSNRKKVHSVLLVRRGKLIFEHYYSNQAESDGTPMPNHFPPSADTPHQMRSITKTVIATLIGQLLYQEKLSSLDTPIYSYYLDRNVLNANNKQQVTFHHALNFNSGLDWREWYAYPSDAMNMWLSKDPYRYVLSKPLAFYPGTQFEYQGAMSVLLGGVIEQITGQNLRHFTQKALFEPLGIEDFDWFSHEVTGDYLGSSGLYLRSRDLAKLGQLYLNKGIWNDVRLFDHSWVDQSFRPQGKFWNNKTIQYGHNWWFPLITLADQTLFIACMRGSGGQEMCVLPDYDLVFVMTSGAYLSQDEDYPFEVMTNFILPAMGLDNASYRPH